MRRNKMQGANQPYVNDSAHLYTPAMDSSRFLMIGETRVMDMDGAASLLVSGAQEIVSLSPGEDPRLACDAAMEGGETAAAEGQTPKGPGKCRRRIRLDESECVQGSSRL